MFYPQNQMLYFTPLPFRPSPGKSRWVDYCHVVTIIAMIMMMLMAVDLCKKA